MLNRRAHAIPLNLLSDLVMIATVESIIRIRSLEFAKHLKLRLLSKDNKAIVILRKPIKSFENTKTFKTDVP